MICQLEPSRARPGFWVRGGGLLAAALVAGVVLRAVLYYSSAGTLDADDGVVGLMAKHAAHADVPVLFWGQNYGGTQEVLVTAPLFLVLGASGLALRAVPLLLVAVTAVLVWRIGLRTSNPVSAVAAACLFWVAPAYLLYKTSHQHGFYASGLVWSAAILLLVLRFASGGARKDAAFLGLALGLAWWETPQIVTVAVPALVWLVWYRPTLLRRAWPAVPAAVVGMSPWIVWNIGHHWSSLIHPPGGDEPLTLHSYVNHVRAYVSSLTPMNLDLRTPFTSSWPVGKLPAELVYAFLLIALGVLGWRRRRSPVSLLVAVMAGYPFMYAASPAAWNAAEPRYALLSLPVIALLLAHPIRMQSAAWVAVAVAVALTALTLRQMDPAVQVMPGIVNPRHYNLLISDLERHKINRVYSDYWIAYRLTFETDERIIASFTGTNTNHLRLSDGRVVGSNPGWSRNWSYNRAVNESDRVAIVFVRGDSSELRARKLLTRHGYQRDTPGQFAVYIPPS